MRMRTVGASGLKVSAIGLGSLTWGGQTDTREVRSLARRFVDAGGNLVDTAPAYGAGSPSNSSESSSIPISVEMTLSSRPRRDSLLKVIRESSIRHVVRCCVTSKGPCAVSTPITSIFGKFMPGEMPPSKKPVRHWTMP